MKVGIIKYNAGNVHSVASALLRLGVTPLVSDEITKLNQMDKIIFPGVGEAASAMNYLKQKHLNEFIITTKKPLLGICLGMQLLCKCSQEGDTACMDIFDTEVKKFSIQQKVPHVGWNNIKNLKGDLFKGIAEQSYFYFVHSYYAALSNNSIADCNYEIDFCCALQKNNFYGVQFHPEKSGEVGERLLKNFIEL